MIGCMAIARLNEDGMPQPEPNISYSGNPIGQSSLHKRDVTLGIRSEATQVHTEVTSDPSDHANKSLSMINISRRATSVPSTTVGRSLGFTQVADVESGKVQPPPNRLTAMAGSPDNQGYVSG